MLTKQQMLSALDDLIAEAARLHALFLQELRPWHPDFIVWLKAAESTVEAIFGSASHALSSFKSIFFVPPPWEQYINDIERGKAEITWFDSGLRFAHGALIGYRYSVERLALEEPARSTPYIFISHGGPALTHVHLVRDFLVALGLGPVVVRDMPNLNLSVNEKVRFYMALCTGAVVLATVEDETTANEQRTRPNVENEIGMLQASQNIGARIIYLKEPAVAFATNYQEKVWIPFSKGASPGFVRRSSEGVEGFRVHRMSSPTPISPPRVKSADLLRPVVESRRRATVRNSLRTSRSRSVPSSFPAQAATPMRVRAQHLLRLKLRVAKCEGRATRAA